MIVLTDALPRRAILAVIDLAGGGTQQVVAGLARDLRDAGVRVTIITNQTSDGRWGDLHTRMEIVELPGHLLTDGRSGWPTVVRNLGWLASGSREIRRVLRSASPGTPVLAFLLGTNLLTSFARIGVDVPLVLCERNDVTRQPVSPLARVARMFLYRTAAAVTTNRPDNLPVMRALAAPVPVHLVSNPLPSRVGVAVPSDSRSILTVGRLTSHKRHQDVVLAFSALAQEFPEWRLRVVGDGEERLALEALARGLSLQGRVEFSGWSTDVPAELERGAILVHASEYEGMSNAILEAMATGLPVVASVTSVPKPSQSEILGEAMGMRLFATGDIPMLTAHLRDLLNDPVLRDQLGQQARSATNRLTVNPLDVWLPVINSARQRKTPRV